AWVRKEGRGKNRRQRAHAAPVPTGPGRLRRLGGRRSVYGQVVSAELVRGVRPAQRQDHPFPQLTHVDADRVGDEERALVELENDHGVGRRVFREIAAAEGRPGENLAPAGERRPLEFVRQALVARGPGRPAELAALRALLETELFF